VSSRPTPSRVGVCCGLAPFLRPPRSPIMVPRNEDHIGRPPPNPRLLSVQSIASKYSARSHSSSFEADDERSTTSGSGRMSPRGSSIMVDNGAPPARYPGEDTRPTSKKELAGWYMYAFAAETYVICGMSLPELRFLLVVYASPCADHP
jgi:MFS transporter, UMF1 family